MTGLDCGLWKCLWPQLASRPETALPVAFVGEKRHQGSVLSVSPPEQLYSHLQRSAAHEGQACQVSLGAEGDVLQRWMRPILGLRKPRTSHRAGAQTHKQASVAVSVVVQWLSPVRLFVTPWSAARRASLSFTASQSLLRLMFIESMMPSNRLILSQPLLLPLPSVFPSIRVFSNEMALLIRWSKYWNFSTSPSNEYI